MKSSRLRHGDWLLAPLLFLANFGLFIGYLLFASFLTVMQTYAAYALLYVGSLLLFFAFVRGVERSSASEYGFQTRGRLEALRSVLVALVLLALFSIVILEPGFIFGFSRSAPPGLFEFGFFLFTSPLVALAQEAVFRGYIFKKLLSRSSLTLALIASAVLFAAQSTNPFALGSLGTGNLVQYLFSSTLVSFALGITMGLYFYKSGWSLLGPVIVRWGLLLEQNLSPVSALSSGWELTFVFQLMGLAALIIAMNALIKEPRLLARKYLDVKIGAKRWRFLKRARLRNEAKATIKTFALLAIIVVSCLVGFQAAIGSSIHLTAIPTGSMRPTIFPGTLVIVQAVGGPQQIHVGDIIEFSPSWFNGSVVHRVISVEPTGNGVVYTTKGDNNTSADPLPTAFPRVTGKVVLIIPYLGLLVLSPLLDIALVSVVFLSSLFSSSLKSDKPRLRRRSS